MGKHQEIMQAVAALNAKETDDVTISDVGDLEEHLIISNTRGRLALTNGYAPFGMRWIGNGNGRGTLSLVNVGATVPTGDDALPFHCVRVGTLEVRDCVWSDARMGLAVDGAAEVRLVNCAAVNCYSETDPHHCGVFLSAVRSAKCIGLELEHCGGPNALSHSLYVDARCGTFAWEGGSITRLPECPIPVTLRAWSSSIVRGVMVDVGKCDSMMEGGRPDDIAMVKRQSEVTFIGVKGRAEALVAFAARGDTKVFVDEDCEVGGATILAGVTGQPGDPGWGAGAEVRCK